MAPSRICHFNFSFHIKYMLDVAETSFRFMKMYHMNTISLFFRSLQVLENMAGLFHGNDISKPVEFFVQTIELLSEMKRWDEATMVQELLNMIPEVKSEFEEGENIPSAHWKQSLLSGCDSSVSIQSWSDVTKDIINVFGSKAHFSMDEKLELFDSISQKGEEEDILAYMVRVKCCVSLIADADHLNTSLKNLPANLSTWMRLLFLCGLRGYNEQLLTKSFSVESLDELMDAIVEGNLFQIEIKDESEGYVDVSNSGIKKNKDGLIDCSSDSKPCENEILACSKLSVKRKLENDSSVHVGEGPSVEKLSKLQQLNDGEEERLRSFYLMNADQLNDAGYCCFCMQHLPNNADDAETHKEDCSQGDKPYKCNKCSYTNTKLKRRGYHCVKKHTNSTYIYRCRHCSAEFSQGLTKLEYQNHIDVHCSALHNVFECRICGRKDFADKKTVKLHISSEHWDKKRPEKLPKKPRPPQETSSNGEVEAEMVKAAKKCEEECQIYQMKEPFFRNNKERLSWSCVHEGCTETWIWAKQSARDQKEPICKRKYEEHIINKHSGVYYQCDLCSQDIKPGPTSSNTALKHKAGRWAFALHLLRSHTSRTEGYDGFMCALETDGVQCQYRTIDRKPFLMHLAKVHLTQYQQVYTCEICGVVYKSKFPLDRHRKREHEGVDLQKFLCPHCPMRFTRNSSLEKHIALKHDESNLKPCNLCVDSKARSRDKLFNEAAMKQHIEDVHSKSRNCPKCTWTGKLPSDLLSHFRIKHLDYKQFKCKTCNNMFTNEFNARAHVQQVHIKDMSKKRDPNFSEKYGHIVEDLKNTEPSGYPSNEYILDTIKQLND